MSVSLKPNSRTLCRIDNSTSYIKRLFRRLILFKRPSNSVNITSDVISQAHGREVGGEGALYYISARLGRSGPCNARVGHSLSTPGWLNAALTSNTQVTVDGHCTHVMSVTPSNSGAKRDVHLSPFSWVIGTQERLPKMSRVSKWEGSRLVVARMSGVQYRESDRWA